MHALVRTAAIRDPLRFAFDDLVRDFLAPRTAPETQAVRPRVDVVDRGNRFELTADLPGVRKEDIKVEIDGERVSIDAESKVAHELKEGERLVFVERSSRRYARSFVLPVEIDNATAQARFENGVLTLILEKRNPTSPRAITVQ